MSLVLVSANIRQKYLCVKVVGKLFSTYLRPEPKRHIMSAIKTFIEDDPEYQAAYREWAERIAREEAEYFAQFESREHYESVTQNPQS